MQEVSPTEISLSYILNLTPSHPSPIMYVKFKPGATDGSRRARREDGWTEQGQMVSLVEGGEPLEGGEDVVDVVVVGLLCLKVETLKRVS